MPFNNTIFKNSVVFILRNRWKFYGFGVMLRIIKIVYLLLYWFASLILHHSANKMAELNYAIFPSASHLSVFNNSTLLLLTAHHANLPILSLKCEEKAKGNRRTLIFNKRKSNYVASTSLMLLTIYFCKATHFCDKSITLIIIFKTSTSYVWSCGPTWFLHLSLLRGKYECCWVLFC